MTPIEQLHRAETAARDGLRDGNDHHALLCDLLAALDAARGEAVAWQARLKIGGCERWTEWGEVDDIEHFKRFHDERGNAYEVRALYAAPPAEAACPNLTPMGECIKARQAVIEGTRIGLKLASGEFEVVADLGNNDSTATVDGPDLVIRNPYRPSESWHEQAQQPAAAVPEDSGATVNFGWTRIVGVDSLPPARDEMFSEDVYLDMPGGEIIIGHCLYRPKGATYSEPAHDWFSISGRQLDARPIAWRPLGLPGHTLDGAPTLAAAKKENANG